MHEASICQSIIETSVNIGTERKLIRIDKIYLMIGNIHHIVDEVLVNYFDIQKNQYPLMADAELIIEKKPLIIKCSMCGEQNELTEPIFICPSCYNRNIEVVQGNELHIIKMEGEVNNEQ
ncbi:MAG: hydrogenase maturation nickel metallochaperone HypA [bacterium]